MRASAAALSCLVGLFTAPPFGLAAAPSPHSNHRSHQETTGSPGSIPPRYCEDLWRGDVDQRAESREFPLQSRGGGEREEGCARLSKWVTDSTEVTRLGAGASGIVFGLKNGEDMRAVKCMRQGGPFGARPRTEVCALLQANRGAKETTRVAPEVFDAWRCGTGMAREEEGPKPTLDAWPVACIEMEFIPNAGNTFDELMQKDSWQAVQFAHDVFSKVQDAIERGVLHNDLQPKNFGRITAGNVTQAVLYDFGVAMVCRSTVPEFLRPLVFAAQLFDWDQAARLEINEPMQADMKHVFFQLFSGSYPRYTTQTPVRRVDLREQEVSGVMAGLQAHIHKNDWDLNFEPEKQFVPLLMHQLAVRGKTVFRPEAVEVIVRFPPPGVDGAAPVVRSWWMAGLVHSWASDSAAAQTRLEQAIATECVHARRMLDASVLNVWRLQGEGRDGDFEVKTFASPDGFETVRYSYIRRHDLAMQAPVPILA